MADLRHALVLTAGIGTRLRPLTLVRAKPAIPVAGEPLVRRIVRQLAAHGVTDAVLNLHHLPATLTRVMGEGADLGLRVRYSWEPHLLGSAGGPRRALPLVAAETFLIVNGDTLTDVDLAALSAAHAAAAALVTIAVTPNRQPLHYGGLIMDRHARVTGVVPRGPGAAGSFHVVGIQAAHADAFSWLPADTAVNSIGDAYLRLIAERPGSVTGFVSEANFWDIGTVTDYLTTSRALSEREGAPGFDAGFGRHVSIDPSARVSNTILWDHIEIGPDCRLDDCIVTDQVRLPRGAVHRRAILIQTAGGPVATPLDGLSP